MVTIESSRAQILRFIFPRSYVSWDDLWYVQKDLAFGFRNLKNAFPKQSYKLPFHSFYTEATIPLQSIRSAENHAKLSLAAWPRRLGFLAWASELALWG